MMQNLSGLIQFAADDTQAATFSASIYRKQLAKYGDWVNPQYPKHSSNPIMTLDDAWGQRIIQNFENNTVGAPIAVPLNHTSDVKANTGRVQSLESIPGDGLYGNLLITDQTTIEKLDKGEIFDVSISFDWNYVRTADNKNYGPTLLHAALVNNPYLTEMGSFEKVGTALSRLEDELSTIGLERAGHDVIMLSRHRVEELSDMATRTIKNEKGFAITVKFKEGDEEKEVVIAPGEEATVPEDVADDVTSQIEAAEDSSTDGDAGAAHSDATGDTTPPAAPANETPEEELARLRQQNKELQLSSAFDKLLAEKKVIPAQRDSVMALAKLPQAAVQLSADAAAQPDVATLVLDILGKGKEQFSTDETGSSKEDENATNTTDQNKEGKKPSELLTADDEAGLKATNVTPEQLDAMAADDNPAFREALVELSKK